MAYLSSAQPDVLCLQELKCTDDQFPLAEVQAAGYQAVFHGQKTYNGVAILAKEPLENPVRGLSDGGDDAHARVIAATVRGVRIISLYAPNGQAVDSPAYGYKLEYYQRLKRYLSERHIPSEPLVVCGDFNVAPEDIDTYDPKAWEGQTLFTERERAALAELKRFGLEDSFRKHHPEPGRFSWWDYRMLAFPKNRGLRIDFVLATAPLMAQCVGAEIDREARKGKLPSDHAPVWADFAVA